MKTATRTTLAAAALGLGAGMIGAPAHAQTADWTGFYFGGTIGLAAADTEGESTTFDTNLDGGYGDTVRTGAGVNAFSPGFCAGYAYGRTPNEGCRDDVDENGSYALKAGYDHQFGSFVIGALGEVSIVNLSDDHTAFSTTPASYTFTRDVNALAAVRGRAGYALGDGLFYATGGAVWADVDHGFSSTNTANSFTSTDGGDNWGYQMGAGFEFQWTRNVSVGLEYIFSNIQDDEHVVAVGRGTAPLTNPFLLVNSAGTNMRRTDDEIKVHQLGVALNWRM
jgi:outer membrane immunogenic protein